MLFYVGPQLYKVSFRYEGDPPVGTMALIHKARKKKDGTIQVFKKLFVFGIANRHSKDSFVKARGRKNALRDALKSTDFNQKQRTMIWNQYLAQTSAVSEKVRSSALLNVDKYARRKRIPENIVRKLASI